MIYFKKVENFIFLSSKISFSLLTIFLMLLKSGIWVMPTFEQSFIIAQNPFTNTFTDGEHFLFWNWLGPFIAYMIGIKHFFLYFIFHLFFSISFLLLFIELCFKNLTERNARVALIIFLALPASFTSFFWVGYDSITLFLLLLSFRYRRNIFILLPVGILLGMQHFEQSFFASFGIFMSVVFNFLYNKKITKQILFPFILLCGVIIGRLLLQIIFNYYGIHINNGRLNWLQNHLSFLLNTFLLHFYTIIWSIFSLGWIVLLKYIKFKNKSLTFLIALFLVSLIVIISGDQTRVIAIITFPLLLYYILLNDEFLFTITNQEVSIFFLTWLIMPISWVWGGKGMWSLLPYDLKLVASLIKHGNIHWSVNSAWLPFY